MAQGEEVFRRQVELISRGEYDAALDMHAPDAEIVTRDPAVAITGKWRGPDGHRWLLEEWDAAWDGHPTYEIEEIVDMGDRFMAVATYRAIGKESGMPVAGTFYWVCTYENGLLKRWETFASREAALAS